MINIKLFNTLSFQEYVFLPITISISNFALLEVDYKQQ